MIRVLIAEDSSTARALLAEILGTDPGIEVIGQAKDGGEAVRLARDLQPDVITMDIRMPVLDGFQATREIMAQAPTPIVVVTGNPSSHEVAFGLRAVDAGALTVQARPPGPESVDFEASARNLIEVVKAMAEVKVVRRRPVPTPRAEVPRRKNPIALIAIAASTGGPPALKRILCGLPADLGVPIVVVQHIAPGFLEGLVEWLDAGCELRVRTAEEGLRVEPNTVHVAPEALHLRIDSGRRMRLSKEPPVDGFRPSATVLFESVADSLGPRAAGVMSSGMGDDGVKGLIRLHEAGGLVLAQSRQTCAVYGMPGAAVAAGAVSCVVDLNDIGSLLVREVHGQ